MQEQMKQAQTQLRTRRLQRQRSMPTALFKPPSPPATKREEKPSATQKPVSIFDTDAIDFIDSDEEAESPEAPKPTENPQNGAAGATENSQNGEERKEIPQITKEPTPEKTTTIATTTVLDNGLIVPVMVESRGYVTTDEEGGSDSESEESTANGIEDSGVCTLDTVTDPDGTSPMQDDLVQDMVAGVAEASMEISKENSVENSIKAESSMQNPLKLEKSMELSEENIMENHLKVSENFMEISATDGDVEDEYFDEDEMGDGFDEGIPA